MKILLTGATGFLGSNILKSLCEKKFDVVILKRTFSKLDRLEKIEGSFKTYDIDKTNLESIFDKEGNIDIVIHCATNYGRNQEMISSVIESNLILPMKILEISVKKGTKLFINTDTCFCKRDKVQGYMQNYILSKKQFLEWGKLYVENKQFSFVNLILEHIYGPGDDLSKFIPFLIESFKNNIKSINLTTGEQYRDFIYVDDVVSAYLAVIRSFEDFKGFREFEVGSGVEIKTKELVEITKELMCSNTILNFGAVEFRENEFMESKADITALLKIGWKPKFDLKMGLREYLRNY